MLFSKPHSSFIVGCFSTTLSGMHLFTSPWLPERKVREGKVIRMWLLPMQLSKSNIFNASWRPLSALHNLLGLPWLSGKTTRSYFSRPCSYTLPLPSLGADPATLATQCLFLLPTALSHSLGLCFCSTFCLEDSHKPSHLLTHPAASAPAS